MCVCVGGAGGRASRNRSISVGQDEQLAPGGLWGSGVCLGVTDNDVFLCFFFLVFRFTFETRHTGQGICTSGCVEM